MATINYIAEAQSIIRDTEFRVLVLGVKGVGKEKLVKSAIKKNIKFYNFEQLCKKEQVNALTENTIELFKQNIIDTKEDIIVLNGVVFSQNKDSNLCEFIKTARKQRKRLIVLAESIPSDKRGLFSFIINLSENNFDRQCVIEEVK